MNEFREIMERRVQRYGGFIRRMMMDPIGHCDGLESPFMHCRTDPDHCEYHAAMHSFAQGLADHVTARDAELRSFWSDQGTKGVTGVHITISPGIGNSGRRHVSHHAFDPKYSTRDQGSTCTVVWQRRPR